MSGNRFTNRFIQIMFHSDLNATRWTLAVAEMLWAVTLLWPGDTFDRPTYTVMSHVMAEEAWGMVFLISSATQFAILFDGKYHETFAVLFAAWNSALWWYVVISMYLSVTPPPAAISGELALAMAAGWIWLRSGYIIQGGRRSTDRE